ncbi:MAG: hypothetical protein GX793_03725 [Bacteroidales bacterium]|nr:hypothetical protein [Bacteroidales bacterium]
MKYLSLLIIFILFNINTGFSQGELENFREPDKFLLNSFGVKFNTNGFGAYYSYTTKINRNFSRFFEFEYNYMKSPKEAKVINPYFPTLYVKKFVFGKTHSVHNAKFGYGINRELFEKRDKNSISIFLSLSGGFTIAASKPIYYEIVDSVQIINNYLYPYTSIYKIDIDIQNNPTDIVGKAPFTMEFSETKLHPGFYLKFGLNFDFSQNIMKSKVLETGIIYENYFLPIEIMAGQKHSNFLNLFISYHFGNKLDAKLNREFRKEQRKLKN